MRLAQSVAHRAQTRPANTRNAPYTNTGQGGRALRGSRHSLRLFFLEPHLLWAPSPFPNREGYPQPLSLSLSPIALLPVHVTAHRHCWRQRGSNAGARRLHLARVFHTRPCAHTTPLMRLAQMSTDTPFDAQIRRGAQARELDDPAPREPRPPRPPRPRPPREVPEEGPGRPPRARVAGGVRWR